MKAIIYARVSSREQEETGYSLPAQEKYLNNYALSNGLEVVRVFSVTESASGHKQRKTFTDMLNYVEKHKVPIILCEKIDRLTRNLKDAAVVNDWVQKDEVRAVHFVKENFIVSKNTRAHENLVWDMKVAIARFYTNNLSEEVKKGQKEKVSQGHLPTKPPLGYSTIGEKGKKVHVVDTDKAHYIREMFELYATGDFSTRHLADEMFKRGLRNRTGRKLGKSRMHELLSDCFYMGNFMWKGERYKGAHEPLISVELFNLVQAKLNRTISSPYYSKHLPVFKGKIRCSVCEGAITWELQKGHWYGGCKSCKASQGKTKYIRQEKVEEQILNKLVAVAPKSERILKILEKALKESNSENFVIREEKLKSLRGIIDRAETRISTMYDDRLDGRISLDEYEARSKLITAEKEDAMREMAKLEKDSSHYYRAGIGIHELALRAKEIYQNPKTITEDRRNLLSFAFSKLALKSGKLDVEYTPGFEFLAKWMPKLNAQFEPQKTVANKRQKTAFAASRPTLLRGQDSNL